MKKVCLTLAALAAYLLVPLVGLAVGPKTFTGTVTAFSGSQIMFSTASAAKYSAETGGAVLERKNGVAMKFSEFAVGDKIQVTGSLWDDNSISASQIIDKSLYAHTGTFTGKITGINPGDLSFTLQSKLHGNQTIHTNTLTSYSKNSGNSNFQSLGLGMTATVKGLWDRSSADVLASSVAASFRLINIYFTGTLSMESSGNFTVIGNGNVIYGVDISKATLQSKNSKPMLVTEFNLGDSVRVWGKHISGGVQIFGTKVKDYSRVK